MLRIVNVEFMGPTARKLLGRNVTGKIHSVFERVFNIKFGNVLVGVARNDVYRSQINMITDVSTDESMASIGVRRGMRARVDGDNVFVGSTLEVSVGEAEIWRPSRAVQNPSSPEVIRHNLDVVKQKVASRDVDEGLGQLLPYLDDILGEGISDLSDFNPVSKKSVPPIFGLVKKSREKGLGDLREASEGLIGVGLGLTPSGDDMLSGFMIARWWVADSFGIKLNRVKEENMSITRGIAEKTTLFSEQRLRYAAQGETNEAVEDFLKAVLDDNLRDIDSDINRVISMGETSGVDTMLGLLLGLETAMEGLDIH